MNAEEEVGSPSGIVRVAPETWRIATACRSPLGATIAGSRWPVRGSPLLHFEHVEVASIEALGSVPADLAIVDLVTAEDVRALAALRAKWRVAVLARTAPGLDVDALSAQPCFPSELALVELGDPDPSRCGRVAEVLVRRGFYRRLQERLRTLVAHEALSLGRVVDLGGFQLAAERRPITRMATIEHEHVSAATGLWWPRYEKLANHLQKAHHLLTRRIERWPEALEKAVAIGRKRGPLRVLCVEAVPHVSGALATHVRAWGEEAGRAVEVETVTTPHAAKHAFARHPGPELVWINAALESAGDGLALVRWIRERRHAVVLFGRTSEGAPGAREDFIRLGAIFVAGGALRPDVVRPQLDHAAGLLNRRRVTLEALAAVGALETDLLSARPAGLGEPLVPLSAVQAEAQELALDLCGGHRTKAARLLRIGRERLGRERGGRRPVLPR